MKKRSLIVLGVAALSVVFLFAVVYATQQAPDDITMESKVYAKHKKALVKLSHKKHNVEYKIPCNECHHVYQDGKNVWKEGDEVKKCDACHSEEKASKDDKSSKQEKIKKYHYSAIHENCKGCHQASKKPTAPTKCAECHPKAAQ